MNLTELFCEIHDFWCAYRAHWYKQLLENGAMKRVRTPQMCESEIMTILIYFHLSHYRNFKRYYTEHVCRFLRSEFPNLVSYNRFVELTPRVLIPLMVYLHGQKGEVSGISFVDSTPIRVCDNKRIFSHKVFDGIAQRGKSSMGWFYGFKLHLIVNDCGELLAFTLTPGNVDDRVPVEQMTKKIWGKLFGDKGYISQKLFELLLAEGVELITSLRKNMKNKLIPMWDKLLLRKRSLIESVNDQLKNISQIEHTRHRSGFNFLVNVVCGLIAYSHQPQKPSLNLRNEAGSFLPVVI